MAYKVKLDIFEGPFDLLVYLIEHAKMSIYDIKVSEILKLTPEKPVFGHISGKRANTHWICFMKKDI